MNELRQRSGVTITVLILAIIILLILAGIVMSAIVGNNGILDTATETKVKAEISSYTEELDVLEVQTKTDQINVGLTASEYIDEFEDRVDVSTVFEDSETSKITSKLLRIQTPEGYVFYVTEDGIEYAGINGEFDEIYELSIDDIIFTYTPSEWTNENVTVGLELNFDVYEDITIQYSFDGETWIEYISAFEVEENCTIYVKVSYSVFNDNYITGEVTNIDTVAPTAEISITDHTYDSITIEAIGSDDDSGIYSYEFQISEDGENWETTDIIISSDISYSYTYEELTQYTEYYVRVVVTDVAGNATTSESASVTTSVDLDTAIITLTPSTTEWTNETVTVTASTETPGVYIEMSTDAENWTETDSLTVSETCTIYARLVDEEGNSSEYALYKVTNIDTISPTVSYEVSSTAESYSNYSTAGSITITSISYDAEATETSGESGLSETYYYSIDGGETYYSSTETECTFTETSTEDDYEIAMYVEDEAGNISEVATETYTPITGDWVDYPIDINGDGDTTNDWRLFYINDDGIMFIIAADYVANTSDLLDLDACGLYSWSNSTEYYNKYALTWENIPSIQSVSTSILSLFMSTNSTINSQITNGTYNNSKCVTTLLNTSNWTNFVDSAYAQAAIGGPTLEMWIASWNTRYTAIYCGYSSSYPYGYSVGWSASSLLTNLQDIRYCTNSGFYDTVYFNTRTWRRGRLLVIFTASVTHRTLSLLLGMEEHYRRDTLSELMKTSRVFAQL